jgi:membrane protease subunit (stomatin/prohibitin family)
MDDIQVARDRAETEERQHDVDCAPMSEREMPCPMCGAIMPDLKGGKASICPNCGFKDSCCY